VPGTESAPVSIVAICVYGHEFQAGNLNFIKSEASKTLGNDTNMESKWATAFWEWSYVIEPEVEQPQKQMERIDALKLPWKGLNF
jgi:hypothetical protein